MLILTLLKQQTLATYMECKYTRDNIPIWPSRTIIRAKHDQLIAFLYIFILCRPVAFLAKMAGEVPGFEWMRDIPILRPDRLVYIGLRDVDEGEVHILNSKNIRHYWSRDVARLGIKTVMDEVRTRTQHTYRRTQHTYTCTQHPHTRARAHTCSVCVGPCDGLLCVLQIIELSKDLPIHISFDIDALDPNYAPATGTPVAGGITLEDGKYPLPVSCIYLCYVVVC